MADTLTPTDKAYQERAGALLRHHRERLNLSTREAATRIGEVDGQGLSRSALSAYELGRRPLTMPMLQRVATAYGIRPRDLVPETEAEGPSYADVTVRVRLGPKVDLEAMEAALVRTTEEHGLGGRVVAGSAPFLPDLGQVEPDEWTTSRTVEPDSRSEAAKAPALAKATPADG